MIHLRTRGLKAFDRDLELPKLGVGIADNGSGKTSIIDGICFAALGYVPRLGKTEERTAALMRDREMEVTLTMPGDRTVNRVLQLTDKGYRGSCETTWLDNDKLGQHELETLKLFGGEENEVAQSLDLRQLLGISAEKRAAAIQALLEAGASTEDLIRSVSRFAMIRLAGEPDVIPDDYRELRPVIAPPQYTLLRELIPMLKGKLAEGLATAISWANAEKRTATNELKVKVAAKKEIDARLEDLPAPDADEVARLEAERSRLDQALGAIKQRNSEHGSKLAAHTAAHKALDDALSQLARVEHERAEYEAQEGRSKGLLDDLGAVKNEIARLTPPVPPNYEKVAKLEADAQRAEAEARAIELPSGPTTEGVDTEIEQLEERITTIEVSPWHEVEEIAAKVRSSVVRGAKGRDNLVRDVSGFVDRLEQLAHEALGATLVDLKARLEDATARRASIRQQARELAQVRGAAMEKRQNLLTEAAANRKRAKTIREEREHEYEQASREYGERRQQCEADRSRLSEAISNLEKRGSETAAALREQRAKVEAARQRLADLGEPAVAEESTEATSVELSEVKHRIGVLARAAATRAELDSIVAEIEARQVREIVFKALEWACQQTRAAEMNRGGGPLVEHMMRFFAGAGRKEAPRIRADFIGWLDPDLGEVPVQTLSAGQWVLFVASMNAAVNALRGASVRLLLVEAADCDQKTFAQLLAGIAAIADTITAALVLTCHEPKAIPTGWERIDLTRTTRAEAA